MLPSNLYVQTLDQDKSLALTKALISYNHCASREELLDQCLCLCALNC